VNTSSSQQLRELPVDAIEPNLHQPRRHFDEASLEELAGSIRERGVLQPVLVRPINDGKHKLNAGDKDKYESIAGDETKYQLIAGERRWRAAKLVGLQTIPALISEYDDLAALEVGLIENMAREDLNPVEEARACVILMEEFGLSHRQIGIRVGRHISVVSNLIRLLGLSAEILELIERGELSRSHALALLMAKDPRARRDLAQKTIEQGWSTRTLQARVHASNNFGSPDSSSAPPGNPPLADGLEEVAMNIAKVWGDALGAEVMVRTLPYRKLRVELLFDSPEGAFALGRQIAEKIARGSKRR
jgi:ParB family chromosome partitioning protein